MRTVRLTLLALLVALVGGALAVPVLSGTAAAGPALESGRALPTLPADVRPAGIALAGDWVYVGLRPYPSGTSADPMAIYRTASDGTGSWAAVTDPDTGQPLSAASMPSVVDGRMLVVGPQDVSTSCTDYRVLGAAVRKIASCLTPRLLPGGEVFRSDTTSGPWILEDSTGAALSTYAKYTVLDGGRSFAFTESFRVDARDQATNDYIRTYSTPATCHPTGPIAATGGYLMVPCTGSTTAIFDTTQDVPPYPLGTGLWFLGTGFATRILAVSGGTELNVVDLGQGKAERSFLAQSSARFANDADGRPQLAFVTPDFQVAMGDLGTLAPRNSGPEDVTPPTISLDTKPAAIIRVPSGAQSATLDYDWSGADPSHPGAVLFDTRETNYYVTEPQPYQDLFTPKTATTYSSQADARFTRVNCFQVRARDWAGNTTDWATACSLLDSEAPWVEWTMPSWTPYFPHLASTPVRLSWTGTDDGGLTTSQLGVRVAPPGGTATTFQVPTGWNALTTRSVSRTYQAGSRVCFQVRMRDRAGNLSRIADTGTRCFAIPYDDRSFTSAGPVHRGSSSLMLGKTYTRLDGNKSWLVRKGVRLRAIHLRISSDWTVVPQIWLGSKRLDRAMWTDGGTGKRRWVSFYFGTSREGTLRIRGSSLAPLAVDAIAVEH